jgi:hypothetical protein
MASASKWKQAVESFEETATATLYLTIPTMLLIIAGFLVSVRGPVDYLKLLYFIAASLVTFHISFWLLRSTLNSRALKAVDYLYLSLGFVGVFGALDVQASVYKGNIARILHYAVPEIVRLNPCKDPDDSNDCVWPNMMVHTLKDSLIYNHSWLEMDLRDATKVYYKNGIPPSHQKFYDQVKLLYDDMQDQVFQYVEPIEQITTERKILAYYILCIGLALRITKVTAELFPRPEDRSSQPLLPTEPSEPHNDGNRKLAEGDVQEGSDTEGSEALPEGSER